MFSLLNITLKAKCKDVRMFDNFGEKNYYLFWGDFALFCHHGSQAGQGTKERYSQPHPQVPLTLCTECQRHTHRPVGQIQSVAEGVWLRDR